MLTCVFYYRRLKSLGDVSSARTATKGANSGDSANDREGSQQVCVSAASVRCSVVVLSWYSVHVTAVGLQTLTSRRSSNRWVALQWQRAATGMLLCLHFQGPFFCAAVLKIALRFFCVSSETICGGNTPSLCVTGLVYCLLLSINPKEHFLDIPKQAQTRAAGSTSHPKSIIWPTQQCAATATERLAGFVCVHGIVSDNRLVGLASESGPHATNLFDAPACNA